MKLTTFAVVFLAVNALKSENSSKQSTGGLGKQSDKQAKEDKKNDKEPKKKRQHQHVSLGPRPYFLIDSMKESDLKNKLADCADELNVFHVSDFSIGHRGACLQFPEHTARSYEAASRMGAGIVECDVTFTKDRQLVCRHDHCDLHTTTDVVLRPELNAKCSTPWAPGVPPLCCTSDFTLSEIKSMCAKMDSSGDLSEQSAEDYVFGGTPNWRTDLYQYECPKVVTHVEYIKLILSLNRKFTPELKTPQVKMPFEGNYTQQHFAQQMIDEYISLDIPPDDVFPQSFLDEDVFYWIENTEYGDQAVALDGVDDRTDKEVDEWLAKLVSRGVKIVAPPMWRLVEQDTDPSNQLGIRASHYAHAAADQGLDVITWTLERTDPGLVGYYWQTLQGLDLVDGDNYALLYVLAFEVGVLGVFSDWPATVTFFANCMDIALQRD